MGRVGNGGSPGTPSDRHSPDRAPPGPPSGRVITLGTRSRHACHGKPGSEPVLRRRGLVPATSEQRVDRDGEHQDAAGDDVARRRIEVERNYYQTVPKELVEAARVDGAGMLRTYWSVLLPISVPSFVVVLIWQFTNAWNDFLFAVFFSSSQNGPVTLALNNLANGALLQDDGISMAGALLASMPPLIVYILLGRYFLGGLMLGSVKG